MYVCMYVCERLARVTESLSLDKNTVRYMYLSNNIFMITAEIIARSLGNFNRQFNWRLVGSNPIWVSDFFFPSSPCMKYHVVVVVSSEISAQMNL